MSHLTSTFTRALQSPPGYAAPSKKSRERILTAQVRNAVAVNPEFPAVQVDWPNILGRQQAEGWGTKSLNGLPRISARRFSGIEGFSLKHMRAFAETCRKRSLRNRRLHNCSGTPFMNELGW
jgi:hypothetical protein